VSAPYGGPDKRGVVFLYHGSETGLITTPVQVRFVGVCVCKLDIICVYRGMCIKMYVYFCVCGCI